MQAQISLDNKNVVIRFSKESMTKEALAHFLSYIELMSLNQNS